MAKRLPSLIKWAGGKEQELKYILPFLPTFQRYYEPFVGGGAVFFSIKASEKLINDRSGELVQFYRMVVDQDPDFLETLRLLVTGWQTLTTFAEAHANELVALYLTFARNACEYLVWEQQLAIFLHAHQCEFRALFAPVCGQNVENFLRELHRNVSHKIQRMRRLEQQKWLLPEGDILANLESALKSAFYMHLRHIYNNLEIYAVGPSVASAVFFFVRENAYASMFRYNRRGQFNVPYGGITYNRKDLKRKIAALHTPALQEHLQGVTLENMDFEAFLAKHPPQAEDFLFLDPPYDSDFSTYMRNEFCPSDQQRLADYLLRRCPAKFLLVIKNTPLIQTLYGQKGLNIHAFAKRYVVSFQDRNKHEAEHLIIMNY